MMIRVMEMVQSHFEKPLYSVHTFLCFSCIEISVILASTSVHKHCCQNWNWTGRKGRQVQYHRCRSPPVPISPPSLPRSPLNFAGPVSCIALQSQAPLQCPAVRFSTLGSGLQLIWPRAVQCRKEQSCLSTNRVSACASVSMTLHQVRHANSLWVPPKPRLGLCSLKNLFL